MVRDVVVMVRVGREYEELRYALRSLVNIPHGHVWVYGGQPSWLGPNVAHVPVRQGPVSHVNTARILTKISENRALSDEFYWWHDDMYVTAPVETVPRVWRSTWDDWAATARERKDPHGPAKTGATVEAFSAFHVVPRYSYELHLPMIVERDSLARMVAAVAAWRPEGLAQVQKRSLYGNWVDYGGQRFDDVKFYLSTRGELGTWASSSDLSLRSPLGQALRDMFAERGPYEKTRDLVDASTKPRGVVAAGGHLAGGRRT